MHCTLDIREKGEIEEEDRENEEERSVRVFDPSQSIYTLLHDVSC